MLKVNTRNLGNVAVVSLQGRLVNGETASLRDTIEAQLQASTVVLDLARVTTVDASGLGLMLELRKRAQTQGVRFKLMNVSRLVRHVLEVTRLDSVFEIAMQADPLPVMATHARAPRVMPVAACA